MSLLFVNSLRVCERIGSTLVLSGSADCSVALWDAESGTKVGDFGQDDHWRLDLTLEELRKSEEAEEEVEEDDAENAENGSREKVIHYFVSLTFV